MRIVLALVVLLSLPALPATAAVKEAAVDYALDGVALEGFLAYDDTISAGRPGVLVVHEWKGLGPHVMDVCRRLAALGYVAFGADIYGKGVRPQSREDAGKTAGLYKKDRKLLRARAAAGLAELKKLPTVNPARVAAIGYCFGGTTVLELARSGAEMKGVVSFHGGLDSPSPEDGRNIRARVLVLHGADDPFVPADDIRRFQEELRAAKVDWQMVSYGGAVHSFTNKEAGNDPRQGAAYDATADRRSWEAMLVFFREIFAPAP